MSDEAIAEQGPENPETVENLVDEATTTPEPEKAPEKSEPSIDERLARQAKGFEKRIKKLTAQRYELQAALDEQKAATVETPQNKPNPDDFETDADYAAAVAEHAAAEAVKRQSEAAAESAKKAEARQAQVDKETQVQTMLQKAETLYEGVTNRAMEIDLTEGMLDAVVAADNSPEVLNHLASDPAEASRIASMSPVAQAMAIGRLAERLTVKPETRAPEPVTPVNDTGATDAGGLSDRLSTAEWVKRRRAQVYK